MPQLRKKTNEIGRQGMYLVMAKILELGIEVIPMPESWHYDLMTNTNVRIEVKYANQSIIKGTRGRRDQKVFAFRFYPIEIEMADVAVLVLNTRHGHYFYIIPTADISSPTVRFNPFSRQKSKYEQYKDRWEFIDGKKTPKKLKEWIE